MTASVAKLVESYHSLNLEEQSEFWDAMEQFHGAPPSATNTSDPDFDAKLARRLEEHLSGKDQSVEATTLHDEIHRKYGVKP